MRDLARIRFVTARVPYLYGLTVLPWCAYGCLDLAWHVGWLDWLPRNVILQPGTYALAATLVAFVADRYIGRQYAALYGKVRVTPLPGGAAKLLAGFLAYLVLTGISRRVFRGHGPDLGMLGAGAWCLWLACRDRPFRAHYGFLAGLAAALAGVPMVGLPQPQLYVIYQLTFVTGLAVAGIGDHLLLAGTVPRVPSDLHEQPV
jgi:hypothetical protein